MMSAAPKSRVTVSRSLQGVRITLRGPVSDQVFEALLVMARKATAELEAEAKPTGPDLALMHFDPRN